jgi:hypothetical protein
VRDFLGKGIVPRWMVGVVPVDGKKVEAEGSHSIGRKARANPNQTRECGKTKHTTHNRKGK